jgi:hypothetical protein
MQPVTENVRRWGFVSLILLLAATAQAALPAPDPSTGTMGFSADPTDGHLIIDTTTYSRFPMAGYRRSFASAQDFAQFAMTNLAATPVLDTNGNVVGVQGEVASIGYPYYVDGSGNKIYVTDPILSYVGGTTGTFVIGSTLVTLTATTQTAAFSTVTPAPPENVTVTGYYAAYASLEPGSQLPSSKGPTPQICTNCCHGGPPTCQTSDGKAGHLQCVNGVWRTCVADPTGPPTVVVRPSSQVTIPLGLSVPLAADLYGLSGSNWTLSWACGGGTFDSTSAMNVTFTPTLTGVWQPTATLTEVGYPAVSSSASVYAPQGPRYNDTGSYGSTFEEGLSGTYGIVGLQGNSYSDNFWVYVDRGAVSAFVVCGGSSPGIQAFWWGSNCVIPDRPGNQITLNLSLNFYYHSNSFQQTQYAYSPYIPGARNVGHIEQKVWRIFLSNGGPVPQFHGVDDIVGECSTHAAAGGLFGRSANNSYLPYCASTP